jgi:hypothetical protein
LRIIELPEIRRTLVSGKSSTAMREALIAHPRGNARSSSFFTFSEIQKITCMDITPYGVM